ncbi:MAG: PaaI family thioesterase [Rhodobacteraceae bacterium]|nr:PaaI family thioesterase [Paracoccaceae bacterium]
MTLKMDQAELAAFLVTEFPQVEKRFKVLSVTPDGVDLRRAVTQSDLRPGGTVSGPALFGLADVAFYLAVLSRIGPEALAVTTNAAIDFMRKPAAGVPVIGSARVLKLGRALAVGDVLLRSEGQEAPVARASLTYSIPPRS